MFKFLEAEHGMLVLSTTSAKGGTLRVIWKQGISIDGLMSCAINICGALIWFYSVGVMWLKQVDAPGFALSPVLIFWPCFNITYYFQRDGDRPEITNWSPRVRTCQINTWAIPTPDQDTLSSIYPRYSLICFSFLFGCWWIHWIQWSDREGRKGPRIDYRLSSIFRE